MNLEQIYVSITMDDGSTAIMGFLTVARGSYLPQGPDPAEWLDKDGGWWKRPATDANIFAEISRTFSATEDQNGNKLPQPVKYRIVKPEDIPVDRTFRNALTDDGKKLHHPVEKCKPIHLAKLRRHRQPLLDQLDRDWMRANAQGKTDELAAIETKRQALRDITKHSKIADAKTPDDLKEVFVCSCDMNNTNVPCPTHTK